MDQLKQRIKELEALEASQITELKSQVHQTTESFRPSNLVRNVFNDMAGSKSFKQEALKASLGIGAGLLIKKIITYKSKGFLGKIAGFALQGLTARIVSRRLPKFEQKDN